MNSLLKTGRGVSFASAESPTPKQPAEAAASICYRMEPAKRMLSGDRCGFLCHPAHGGDGNHMPPCLLSDQQHSVIDLEKVSRLALMITPQEQGDVVDQAWEAISTMRAILRQQPHPMTVTLQTVFLRSAEDEAACKRLLHAYFGEQMPATNFVVQPPCGGQALAIEAWALGGEGIAVDYPQPDVVAVRYDGLRWLHVAGISPPPSLTTAFPQSQYCFDELARRLKLAGASLSDVVRTWLYLGGITEHEQQIERYRELNRARTEFFDEQAAIGRFNVRRNGASYYPASTGIGMAGRSLAISAMALQTERDDVRLLPLENPRQTSAFNYARRFSQKSPKFSRAMAVLVGDYATTWVSGTASIVDSESVYLGDVERQTEQTIDNIEGLISRENFARHGVTGAGARLQDLAKIRVYVKRPEDYEKCRAICERRFGSVPAVYAQADVCRSELLVEIEGVAFSPVDRTTGSAGGGA